ncbi:hypothetical protein [Microbacterium sp. NPDC058345]|uniref:hypothetical protein n=1 Tax=Microbacterium sp. NPDC058345 TaxID=3346455 RepID=UPI00364AE34B
MVMIFSASEGALTSWDVLVDVVVPLASAASSVFVGLAAIGVTIALGIREHVERRSEHDRNERTRMSDRAIEAARRLDEQRSTIGQAMLDYASTSMTAENDRPAYRAMMQAVAASRLPLDELVLWVVQSSQAQRAAYHNAEVAKRAGGPSTGPVLAYLTIESAFRERLLGWIREGIIDLTPLPWPDESVTMRGQA